MPTEYTCSSCGLKISAGSFHGGEFGNEWFTLMHCRYCGTCYTLQQSATEFFGPSAANMAAPRDREFELRGPARIQRVLVSSQAPTSVTCEGCKAEGPFGSEGPITSEPPAGLGSVQRLAKANTEGKVIGICPACHKQTMKFSAEWET